MLADKKTGPVVLFGQIKPVKVVSIYLGMSPIAGYSFHELLNLIDHFLFWIVESCNLFGIIN